MDNTEKVGVELQYCHPYGAQYSALDVRSQNTEAMLRTAARGKERADGRKRPKSWWITGK